MSDWQKRYQRLLFDRPHPKVLRVTMNRPEKYNATDAIMHRELVDVWRDIDGDDTVNCVIIQGAGGKVFSAGGDFDIIEKNITDYNALLRTWKEARDIVYNVINCSKPIVSTMRGPAVGAGLVAGILADVSIASKKARIIDGHTRLGVAAGDHAVIVWPRPSTICCCAKRSTARRPSASAWSRSASRTTSSKRRASRSRPSSPRVRRPRSASPSTRSTTGCA